VAALWEDMERKLSDLASLRNQELLARLHPEERAAFARLWADVEALVRKARQDR